MGAAAGARAAAACSDQRGGSTASGSPDAIMHAPHVGSVGAHNGGGGSGCGSAVLSAVPRLTQLLHSLPVARPGLRVHPAKGRALVFWWVVWRPGAATVRSSARSLRMVLLPHACVMHLLVA